MTRLTDDVRVVAVRQDSEPASFDWTATGARTFTIDRYDFEELIHGRCIGVDALNTGPTERAWLCVTRTPQEKRLPTERIFARRQRIH